MFPFDGYCVAARSLAITKFFLGKLRFANEATILGRELFGIDRSIRDYEEAISMQSRSKHTRKCADTQGFLPFRIGRSYSHQMMALTLTRYERARASSRLRTIQFAYALRAHGIESLFKPLFNRKYLQRLYAGQSTTWLIACEYLRRMSQLKRAMDADLVWLETDALPWLPWCLGRVLLPGNIPLVVDYKDAIFHRHDLYKSRFVLRLLGKKLDNLTASASLVTVENRYLADRATAAGASCVEIIPTVVDLTAYTQRPRPPSEAVLTIGWLGTPSTWTEYMAPLMPLLGEIAKDARERVIAVDVGST